ncbi:glycosyltransferase [Marinobacterium aestuarii]|uniref:glycosyltransferase n=1 Tax=Marinobacterium aestuarii TaxID=1821621 RepID=UPI000B271AE2|nr:glycosyltransferase [Marinobacterium aestuarii]
MIKGKVAVIIAPFWGQPGNVGNNRIDRFIRWLNAANYSVVVVKAARKNRTEKKNWGVEVSVRDPLGLYRDVNSNEVIVQSPRKPSKVRRSLAYLFFNPDPGVVWARIAARNSGVLEVMEGASFILSSSPPESAHICAFLLSKKTRIPLVIDMRDGWLDEPLKPFLSKPSVRRWLESRHERKILSDAAAVFVTSDTWKLLLCKRFPHMSSKINVLTNSYPHTLSKMNPSVRRTDSNQLVFVHTGRFIGSRSTQSPEILLSPLLNAAQKLTGSAMVRFIGDLSTDEIERINPYRIEFEENNWLLTLEGPIVRAEIISMLNSVDGFLLLCASYAAIPSKLFEYIPEKKPILVVTYVGSATWNICKKLPQSFLFDILGDAESSDKVVRDFITASSGFLSGISPVEYSEEYTSRIFLRCVDFI